MVHAHEGKIMDWVIFFPGVFVCACAQAKHQTARARQIRDANDIDLLVDTLCVSNGGG